MVFICVGLIPSSEFCFGISFLSLSHTLQTLVQVSLQIRESTRDHSMVTREECIAQANWPEGRTFFQGEVEVKQDGDDELDDDDFDEE